MSLFGARPVEWADAAKPSCPGRDVSHQDPPWNPSVSIPRWPRSIPLSPANRRTTWCARGRSSRSVAIISRINAPNAELASIVGPVAFRASRFRSRPSTQQAGEDRTQTVNVRGAARNRAPQDLGRLTGRIKSQAPSIPPGDRTSAPVKSSMGWPHSSNQTWLGSIRPWTSPSEWQAATAPARVSTRGNASASDKVPRSRITLARVLSPAHGRTT